MLGGVVSPSRWAVWGREALPEGQEGLKGSTGGQEGLGGPPGEPGRSVRSIRVPIRFGNPPKRARGRRQSLTEAGKV